MKHPKIVLVAEWDGWCGACAADRPLVLTRTGRQRLRTWLTAAADDSRPLLLTCRLCGTGVAVPLEQDDPPVVLSQEEPARPPAPVETVGAAPAGTVPAGTVPAGTSGAATAAAAPLHVTSGTSAAELTAGRQVVAQALAGLLARRAAAGTAPPPAPVPQLAPVPLLAPALPLQRTASSGGLAELQLLADGIDLLSGGRS